MVQRGIPTTRVTSQGERRKARRRTRRQGALELALSFALLAFAGAPARAQDAAIGAFVGQIGERLARHPYFARTRLERVDSPAPYLFFVQPAASGHREAEIVAQHVALLEPLRARFVAELATPLGLTQRADTPALLVIVLASQAAYEDCYRATAGAWHFDAQATFERDVGAAILYDDPAAQRAPAEVEHSARHVFVHALQNAYAPGPAPLPVRSWLFEGMADWLARAPGATAFAAPERLAEFVQDAATPATRWAHLRTLEEMCAVDEPLELARFFQRRTRDSALMPGADRDPWTAFYRQATLYYAFLQQEPWRAGLQHFSARAFAGTRGADVLAASVAPKTLAEAEQAFAAWILKEHARAFPGEKVKPELVLGALSRDDLGTRAHDPEPPQPGAATATTASPAAPAEGEPLPPLALADATEEERFALALNEIGAGRIRAGRERLAELRTSALGPRAEREELRAAEFEGARDAFLRRALGEQSLLELDLGPRVTANKFSLRAFSEGLVELDDNKGGIRRVPVETLDPLALARQMGGAGAEDRVRFYLYVLRGDERWKKLLKPDGGAATALLEDARNDYPPRLHLGDVLVRLQTLGEERAARTPKEIEQRLERFRALLKDGADTALVARKKETLRRHVRALLEQKFELLGPSTFVHGKFEALGSTRVRITYAFDDAHELEDFGVDPYPVLAGRELRSEKSDDQPFHVEKGKLRALGTASLRSLYELAAPMSVRYDLEFEEAGNGDPVAFFLALGICDDGQEHFLWAINLDTLQRIDPGDAASTPERDSQMFLSKSYPLELRHDGEQVTLFCEGTEQGTLEAGTRNSGALFLRATTDLPLCVQKLVFEGNLSADSFKRMRQTWAERQMAGF